MTTNQRRDNCLKYQGIVDRHEKEINGDSGIHPGLVTKVNNVEKDNIIVKTKLNIMTTLQTLTLVAMITGVVKLFIKG